MAHEKPRSQKLYCYVDETGQGTLGQLFIVVAVVMAGDRQELLERLDQAEHESGGRLQQPWSKSNRRRLDKYLELALQPDLFTGSVFYQVFKDSTDYKRLTAETVVRSLNRYAEDHSIPEFKATIIIDGLTRTAARRVRNIVLNHHLRIDKIRGERDESSPILRLADAITKPIRRAMNRDWPSRALIQKAKADGVITQLH